MISHLFFRLLPMQVAIVAMGSVNSIVDGVVAARFIDAETIGVVGLYYSSASLAIAMAKGVFGPLAAVYLLPLIFGNDGIWYTLTAAEILALLTAGICFILLKKRGNGVTQQ